MTKQSGMFLEHEGDAWYQRNRSHLLEISRNPDEDPVILWMKQGNRPFNDVVEIGCSNGWRLDWIQRHWNSICHGIEPSSEAIRQGIALFPDLDLRKGTADVLPFHAESADLLIFGFCLYLCDRSDLFRIAAEADRVLAPGGQIVIYDFDSSGAPSKTAYRHLDGVYSYRFDHTKMFAWHPHYSIVGGFVGPHPGLDDWSPASRISVCVLEKSTNPE